MNNHLSTAGRHDVVLDDERPWPGLVSFTEVNQHYFFGREQESNEVVRMIEAEALTILYGKSGLGKSSLLQAGISPRLRALQFVPVYMRLNYGVANDDAQPAASATAAVWTSLAEVWSTEDIEAPPRVESETLWEYFHRRSCDWWDAQNRLVRPVLIFDQFEELLTARHDGSEAQRAHLDALLDELADLIGNRPPDSLLRRSADDPALLDQFEFDGTPCRVVLSLRDDFLANIEELRSRIPSVMVNRFCLQALAGEQALDAIVKPGWRLVDEAVAIRIALFVSSSGRQSGPASDSSREILASRQVDPALLSVVLEELNNTRIERHEPRITPDQLGEGRAEGILRNYYERQLADESEAVRDFVVDHLLTASGARNKFAEEDACAEPGISIEVIERLIRKRLIRRERSGAVKWLELTHDRLAEVVRLDRQEQEKRRQQSAAEAARAAADEAQREAEAALAREAEALERLLDETTVGTVAVVRRNLRQLAADTREFTSPQLLLMSARVETAAAEILTSRGYVTEGIEAATRALDVIGRIGGQPDSPDPRSTRAAALYVLGTGKRGIGDLAGAEAALRTALQSLDPGAADRRFRSKATIALGSTLLELGRSAAGAATFQEAIDDLAGDATEGSAFLTATALLRLADRGQILDRLVFRRAESLVEHYLRAHPQSLRWRLLKVELSMAEGFDTVESSGAAKSRARLREALREAAAVYDADPDNLEARRGLASIHRLRGMHYAAIREDEPQARAAFERMREHADAVCSQQPAWVAAVRTKAISLYHLAGFDRDGEARLEEGCRLIEELSERARGHVVVNRDLALFYLRLGVASADHGRALAWFEKAGGTLAQAPAAVLESADYQSIAADILLRAADRRQALGRPAEEAETDHRSAIAAFSAALSAEPLPNAYGALATAHFLFAGFLLRLADVKRAAEEFRAALDVCSRGLTEHPANVALLEKKMSGALGAAQAWHNRGDLDEAAAFMSLAIEATVEAIAAEPNSYALCQLAMQVHAEGLKIAGQIDSAAGQEGEGSPRGALQSALESIEPARLLWSAAPAIPWDVPPLMQAGWRQLTRAEQHEEVQRLAESGRQDLAGRIGRMRAAFLSFYPDGILYEAEVLRPGAPAAVFGYVRSGAETLVLDGTSKPIHTFNEQEAVELLLGNATQAADYARFFAAAIQGKEGNFRIVANLDEIPMSPSADGEQLARLQRDILSLQLCEAPDGAWDFKATVRYGQSLFNSLFRVPPNGVVSIKADRPVANNLPLLQERFEDGLRIVRRHPRDRYHQLRRDGEWAAAASEQQNHIATLRASEGVPAATLAGELMRLAWDQLHAADFDGAFRSSDEARRLDPARIVIETNLAHALLFLGRIDEARAVYHEHLGKMIGDRTWQQMILEDFDSLAKAGITHPEMDRFRDEVARRSP